MGHKVSVRNVRECRTMSCSAGSFCLSWLMSTDSVFVFSGLTPRGFAASVRNTEKSAPFREDSFILVVRATISGPSTANTDRRLWETTSPHQASPDQVREARGGTAEARATIVPERVRSELIYSD